MRLEFRTVPVDDEIVAEATRFSNAVMIDDRSRGYGSKKHLRPHKDQSGRWYVRCGLRGSARYYLSECQVTVIDGSVALHAFRLDYAR